MKNDWFTVFFFLMNYSYEWLLYSLVDGMTIRDLKAWNYEADVATEDLLSWMKKEWVGVCVQGDSDYHFSFLSIKSAPYVYYYQWDHDILHKPTLSIVGPRKMSDYGREVLEHLFSFLWWYDIVTVSGLAAGVDSLCHELSIKESIPTVAVLWAGLWHFLRWRKRAFLEQMIEAWGLVISEFPLKMKPAPWSFPQRNRLIAWLGQCLFLPEAWERSGSLITVENAWEMKKHIYGAPQSIFSINSKWLLSAMSEGKVHVVSDIESFLEKEFWDYKKNRLSWASEKNILTLSDEQQKIVSFLAECDEWGSLDLVAWKTALRVDVVMSNMTMLELQGCVKELRTGIYVVR